LAARFGAGTLACVFALAELAFGVAAGWTINGWRWEARFNGLQTGHEQALNAAQRAVTTALEKAREVEAKGEALAQRQLALEANNRKLSEERKNALRKLTTGRACLGADALKLLNDTSAAGHIGLRPPADGALGSPAAAFSDSGEPDYAATDTDIALWAEHARAEYDICRGRIDALKSFYDNKEN
jgi:hypothetical protein